MRKYQEEKLKNAFERFKKIKDGRCVDSFCDIVDILYFNENRIEYLEEENRKLKDEHYKAQELKKMKESLKEMEEEYYRGFPISKSEQDKINQWISKHEKDKHNNSSYAGAIGGRFSYHFIPTSIGTFRTVKCSCGEKFDFQEP